MKKMTNPILWGTGLWQLLFQAANNQDANVEELVTLVFEFLPLLLPCRECRANYPRHAKRVEVRFGNRRLKTPRDVFRWLYLLKDEVGKQLGRSSPPLKHIELAYEHHGSLIDEVRVADTLVTIAIEAHAMELDALYVRFCHMLSWLIHPMDAPYIVPALRSMRRPITTYSHQVARSVRTNHGRYMKPFRSYGA